MASNLSAIAALLQHVSCNVLGLIHDTNSALPYGRESVATRHTIAMLRHRDSDGRAPGIRTVPKGCCRSNPTVVARLLSTHRCPRLATKSEDHSDLNAPSEHIWLTSTTTASTIFPISTTNAAFSSMLPSKVPDATTATRPAARVWTRRAKVNRSSRESCALRRGVGPTR